MKCMLSTQTFSLRRAHLFLRWSARLFFAIGTLALGYCGFVLLNAWFFQVDHAWRFQRALEDSKWSAGSNAHDQTAPLPPTWTASNRVRDENPNRGTADAGSLGRIEIRRIGVAAMIMEGTDAKVLQRAVGHVAGTALPGEQGNIAIAGHRDTFFRALRNIRQDDEITLTTLNGTYSYRVDSTQVVEPDDTEVIGASPNPILTLVTCYPFYYVGPAPKRFIVRAHWSPL
jgi:sortase A